MCQKRVCPSTSHECTNHCGKCSSYTSGGKPVGTTKFVTYHFKINKITLSEICLVIKIMTHNDLDRRIKSVLSGILSKTWPMFFIELFFFQLPWSCIVCVPVLFWPDLLTHRFSFILVDI